MNRYGAAFLLGTTIVLCAGVAEANSTAYGNMAAGKWKASDKCARQAQAAFPDFTPEANAKREASLKACLEGGALPPRESLTPGH
jgi:hypothetical protein